MMNKFYRTLLSAITLLFLSLPCNASLTWELNNFQFSDGSTVTGSFDWDSASNTIDVWDITISQSFFGSPTRYTNETGTAVYSRISSWIIFKDYNSWQLRFGIRDIALLSDPNSTVFMPDQGHFLVGFTGFLECFNCSPQRNGNFGAFLSSPVPIPAAVWLMGSGLLGLVGFSRKNKAQITA